MIMDQIGHNALYEHMLANGYTGTTADWRKVTDKASYASEIRIFLSLYSGSLGQRYPLLVPWLKRLCANAEARFDTVQTHTNGAHRCSIYFGLDAAVAIENPKHRLTGLTISLNAMDGRHLEILVQAYGAGDRSKETTVTFDPNRKG